MLIICCCFFVCDLKGFKIVGSKVFKFIVFKVIDFWFVFKCCKFNKLLINLIFFLYFVFNIFKYCWIFFGIGNIFSIWIVIFIFDRGVFNLWEIVFKKLFLRILSCFNFLIFCFNFEVCFCICFFKFVFRVCICW